MRKLLILYAILFSLLICWNPHLGPIDDEYFLQPFKLLKFWFDDRFYPLDGMEQLLITKFFGIQPFLAYLVNSLEFLGLFYLFVRIVRKVFPNRPQLAFWIPVLASLTPGLTTAYFRIFIPERLLVLCLTYLVYLDLEEVTKLSQKVIYFFLAVACMLLKEPAFLIIGGLSFFRFLEKKDRPFHGFMMALCVGYLGLYFYLTRVVQPVKGMSYGSSSISGMQLLAKNIFNYLLNDPAIYLFAIPTWIIVLVRRKKLDTHFTLIVGYSFLFLYLGIFQEYYLLPLLPLLIIAAGKHWDEAPRVIRLIVTFLIINASIYGLGQISIYKNEPRGFSETIAAITKENKPGLKTVCYLGLNTEFSAEILYNSSLFYYSQNSNKPLVEFRSTQNALDEKCDFLINSPYNYSHVQADPEWKVVHHSKTTICFPAISLKPWIKELSSKTGTLSLINQNIFRNHDYILMKR